MALCGLSACLLLAGCVSRGPDLSGPLASLSSLTVETPAETFHGTLTLDTAIERATAASEEITTLLAQVKVAVASKDAARDWRDPQLRLSYGNDTSDTLRQVDTVDSASTLTGAAPGALTTRSGGTIQDDGSGYRCSVRFFPPNPWTAGHRVSAESAGIYAAVSELLAARWRLRTEVRELFARVHYLDRDVLVLDELVELYRDTLALLRERVDRGEATVQALMVASRRYLGALNDRDETEREAQRVRRELAGLVVAAAADLRVSVDERSFPRPDLSALDSSVLVSFALERRSDVSALFWRARAAAAACEEYSARRIPWPAFIQLSYGSDSASSDRNFTETGLDAAGGLSRLRTQSGHDEGDASEWRVDAAFEIPVFSWWGHEDDVLREQWRGAEAGERKARARVGREIRDALSAVHNLSESRRDYDEKSEPIIAEMQKTLAGIEGVTGLAPDDVARIREQILESRRMRIRAESQYQLAVMGLETVLGVTLDAVPLSQDAEPPP